MGRPEEELKDAFREGNIPGVKLLVEGRANIAGTSEDWSALELAAIHGNTVIVEWLVAEGWANASEVSEGGCTALLYAADRLTNKNVGTVQWLLEYGGADITDTTPNGQTLWDSFLNDGQMVWEDVTGRRMPRDVAGDRLTALLRVMVLQSAPPADFAMSSQHY
jgi:hypothetical protein